MTNKPVIIAEDYDLIDGRNAYHSDIKELTVGTPLLAENEPMQIAVQIRKKNADDISGLAVELPIHQALDLAILLCRTMLHFKEAYRFPLLYDPEKPAIERVGLQGGVMPVSVCTENPSINEDIQAFSQALSDLGELTGERLRTLSRILKEMEY